jgi:uncharacterized protein YfaP (DUF2135 family)
MLGWMQAMQNGLSLNSMAQAFMNSADTPVRLTAPAAGWRAPALEVAATSSPTSRMASRPVNSRGTNGKSSGSSANP